MGIPITLVDAFTSVPFAGNPAAVCVLTEPRDAHWMQLVAAEMNLSETAFLNREADGYALRWFTPEIEVELCGHATLASAHVLWQEGHLPPGQQARFMTRSGLLTADRTGDWIELDFPAVPQESAAPPPDLVQALRIQPRYVGRTRTRFLVEVQSEDELRKLQPDFALLREIPVEGVIVTSTASDPQFDFVSRFFAPRAGVNEDPVCGSAHCCLAPFWGLRLGKDELVGYQASPRGGVVRVRMNGTRVRLGGQAVTVLHGELL